MMRVKTVILLVSIVVVGCNYKKNTDIEPNIEVPMAYSEGGETTEAAPPPEGEKAEPIRDVRWWRDLGDPTLTALIEEALRRNQGIRAGWARVNQARYIANQVRAARMPQIGAVGDFTAGRSIFAFGEVTQLNAIGSIPVSYEVDLFARRARDHPPRRGPPGTGRCRRGLVRFDQRTHRGRRRRGPARNGPQIPRAR